MPDTCDIAIIGAGAAGLAASVFAAQAGPGLRVALLDGAVKLGAKILVSGGGRCNVVHQVASERDFQGPPHLVRRVLRSFDASAVARWFDGLGVALKVEPTGKLFPIQDDARVVLAALLDQAKALGVTILTEHRVVALERQAMADMAASTMIDGSTDTQANAKETVNEPWPAYRIVHTRGVLLAHRVILATGGRSLPKTGSDGGGYKLAANLGHRITPTYPALVPLCLDASFFHAGVTGLACEAELSVHALTNPGDPPPGPRVGQARGDLLWTHFGISGPVAMDVSRHWTVAQGENRSPTLRANLMPGSTFEVEDERWVKLAATHPRRSLAEAMPTRWPRRLSEALLRAAGVDPALPAGKLARESRRNLVKTLVDLELPVVGPRGWNYAEVTAGGVPMAEIEPGTMQSRLAPGLYLCGEILDVDGRIGGFNFHWAWATARLAGQAAAKVLSR